MTLPVDEEAAKPNLKLLEMAQKWKKKQAEDKFMLIITATYSLTKFFTPSSNNKRRKLLRFYQKPAMRRQM